MNVSFLRWLRCPFCAGNLKSSKIDQVEAGYDVLTCYCSRYPLVAGIPILKRGVIGTGGQTAAEVIGLIEAGRHREALFSLMSPAPLVLAPAWMQLLPSLKGMGRLKSLAHRWALQGWREQAATLLMDPRDQVTACALFDFYFRGPNLKDGRDYFAFRFSQPRHLVALSFTSVICQPEKPILDLACGFGHITCSLVQRAKDQQVIGVDTNFFSLYVAKNWIAPEAEYVCCEADKSLPFPDGAFSAVFCSDAFHYFVNKAVCVRELKRLTQYNGLIVLVVLRNALLKYREAGLPLPPEGYRELFSGMPHCLVANSDVLARYLQKQGPPLARSTEIGLLAQEPTLSLAASYRAEVFRDYGFFDDWPHAEGHLGLNPIYVEDRRDGPGNVYLRRTFPTAWYEEDNFECKQYLPETLSANASALLDLAHGKRTPEIERLIERCVVLGMPERYR